MKNSNHTPDFSDQITQMFRKEPMNLILCIHSLCLALLIWSISGVFVFIWTFKVRSYELVFGNIFFVKLDRYFFFELDRCVKVRRIKEWERLKFNCQSIFHSDDTFFSLSSINWFHKTLWVEKTKQKVKVTRSIDVKVGWCSICFFLHKLCTIPSVCGEAKDVFLSNGKTGLFVDVSARICAYYVGDVEIFSRQMQTFDLCYGNEHLTKTMTKGTSARWRWRERKNARNRERWK